MTTSLNVSRSIFKRIDRFLDLYERHVTVLEAQRPAPTPAPDTSAVVFEMTDWTQDFPAAWFETSSPETTPGSNVSTSARVDVWDAQTLAFEVDKLSTVPEAGARALYDPTRKRSWLHPDWYDRTVEFINTWEFPQKIERNYGDGGWLQAGWQFKGDPSAGARASMAMLVQVYPDGGMRWYLNSETSDVVADSNFPIIPVGVPVETRLLVHFHDDPLKGWMQLEYAGATLKVTGANMSAKFESGAYLNLYGTVNGVMLAKQTRIALAG